MTRYLKDLKAFLSFKISAKCSEPVSECSGVTFGKDLGDLCVAGTKCTVDFKTVRIVQEGSAKRKQNFLKVRRE